MKNYDLVTERRFNLTLPDSIKISYSIVTESNLVQVTVVDEDGLLEDNDLVLAVDGYIDFNNVRYVLITEGSLTNSFSFKEDDVFFVKPFLIEKGEDFSDISFAFLKGIDDITYEDLFYGDSYAGSFVPVIPKFIEMYNKLISCNNDACGDSRRRILKSYITSLNVLCSVNEGNRFFNKLSCFSMFDKLKEYCIKNSSCSCSIT